MPKARIIEKGIFKNKYFKKNEENNFVFKSPQEFEKVLFFFLKINN